jgi:hypothetical protein
MMLDLLVDDYYEEQTGNRMKAGGISFKKIHHVKMYPNPASTFLHYEVRLNEKENGSLTIFDYLGHEVLKKPIYNGFNQLVIDIGSLPNGIYFIHLETNSTFQNNEKFIIQK